jgi:hypothetical protein
MGQQKVVALLDLPAAIDTTDYTQLFYRLSSWFGFSGTAFSLIKSYLTSRSFEVDINDSL